MSNLQLYIRIGSFLNSILLCKVRKALRFITCEMLELGGLKRDWTWILAFVRKQILSTFTKAAESGFGKEGSQILSSNRLKGEDACMPINKLVSRASTGTSGHFTVNWANQSLLQTQIHLRLKSKSLLDDNCYDALTFKEDEVRHPYSALCYREITDMGLIITLSSEPQFPVTEPLGKTLL